MRRLPIIATALVTIAIVAMIALGIWQLQRADTKAAMLAVLAKNAALPPMAYPAIAPVADASLFRKSQVMCLRVTGWRVEGGSTPSGKAGYRHIAECSTGAEGPGALVDMGVSADPKFVPTWRGGSVDGLITTEPQHRSLLGRLFTSEVPPRPMLVADKPAPGLAASAPPSIASIPNNHLAYAVQWFLFAGVAGVIFVLALRRRGSGSMPPKPPT